MATYLTTPFPGEDPSVRLLGSTPRGHLAILTCLGPADSGFLEELRQATEPAPRSRLLATLVELGTRGGQLWAVERALGVHTLDLVLKRVASVGCALPDALCAHVAFRILEAVAGLGREHGRLTPMNVLLLPNGELQVLGAQYARHLPPRPAELMYLEVPEGFEAGASDVFSAAQIARALALRRNPRPGERGPAALESLLPDHLDAPPAPEVARATATELAGFAKLLGLPSTQPTRAPLELSTVSFVREEASEFEALEEADAEADQFQPGPAMDANGRIDLGGHVEPTQPAPRPKPAAAEPVELDRAAMAHAFPPAEEPAPTSPPRRSVWRALGLTAIALAALGALAVVGVFALSWRLPTWLQPRPAHPGVYGRALLRIESEPSGATVLMGSEEIGLTPYLSDNDYPDGDNTFSLKLSGHQPYQGSFQGGRDVTVRAKLRRR